MSEHLPGKADETHVNLQSRCPLSEMIFQPKTFTTRSNQCYYLFCGLMAIVFWHAALVQQPWTFMVIASYFRGTR